MQAQQRIHRHRADGVMAACRKLAVPVRVIVTAAFCAHPHVLKVEQHSSPVQATPQNRHIAKMARERTYIMIKPDGVQRGLVGEIIKRFEQKGFKLVALKLKTASTELLEQHYADLKGKAFFPSLITYMASGPVCCMVWEGSNAVYFGRKLLGETRPYDSLPGTIRGDFCVEVGRNICHGSDSVESAENEIALWFDADELNEWKQANETWIYE
eukprot:gene3641-6219_t